MASHLLYEAIDSVVQEEGCLHFEKLDGHNVSYCAVSMAVAEVLIL